MCTILMLAMAQNSSPERCAVLPGPPLDPKLSCPGLDLAKAINSLTELTGMEALIMMTFGERSNIEIGAKSLTGS